MVKITTILQTPSFKKAIKKLHKKSKEDLDKAVHKLVDDPLLGEQKKGDLSYMRVYKFKMSKQLALGSHEIFYRDAKKSS